MKKIVCMILALTLLSAPVLAVDTIYDDAITIAAPYAVLMEKSTGEIIYEKASREHVYPASVTKVMTLLLVVEEIEAGRLNLSDLVTGSARACSMGGSQIWLEEGEQMTVDEMIKCVAVVSANDCCVALAEHIAGSEEAFVSRMNERAQELGMNDTNFTNCSGLLENENHYTSAYDTAIMSRELISHDMIKDYTTIWMDTARDGKFQLSNTNKLIYYYDGATGLKTGFTSKAMYCLAATAERNGVEYIAVVFKCQSSSDRFESAKTLLNYAFANYEVRSLTPGEALPPVTVELGRYNSVQPVLEDDAGVLIKKSEAGDITYETLLPESLQAPIAEGERIGTLNVYKGTELLSSIPLIADTAVEKLSVADIFISLLKNLLVGSS